MKIPSTENSEISNVSSFNIGADQNISMSASSTVRISAFITSATPNQSTSCLPHPLQIYSQTFVCDSTTYLCSPDIFETVEDEVRFSITCD